MSRDCTVETCTVETSDGVNLQARIFSPKEGIKDNLVIVLVHPYSVLGGCQGLLRGIASGLASKGYRAVTFDMRGVGRSTGRASLTGFQEIKDVVAVCKWVCHNLSSDRILLVGSSAEFRGSAGKKQDPMSMPGGKVLPSDIIVFQLEVLATEITCKSSILRAYPRMKSKDCPKSTTKGAPISGSAVDEVEQVIGYVSLGYPFGMISSILFGRHHKAILQSPKPKLFVMGTRDGFTSVNQLKNKLTSAAGRVETHLIEGVSHFQMEGPAFDAQMKLLNVQLSYKKHYVYSLAVRLEHKGNCHAFYLASVKFDVTLHQGFPLAYDTSTMVYERLRPADQIQR
ncbi:hypothetical protein RJ639_001880 [Escallonia herrerae]|uniref:Xaa-Pro dipeptidyl-peptidase-like domain-containing protein n=1 Tax=Escallonia herrerae TaxID=1293975 RepID=A0AA89BH88_9ASTE|nr:hypothetical protein RJ639_001880 [Escallonia herrerae]